ncbi:MAG: cyanophycinase [Chitinophagaceae bacterium]|nr:cyanophycinase [Chitinophagaceae bacterium]
MNKYFYRALIFLAVFSFAMSLAYGQKKGNLFIIGGGERSAELLEALIKTADFGMSDYIVILPMASGVPDESVAYIRSQLSEYCKNPVTSFNFTQAQANDHSSWIDSVRNARLIYIAGGDQNRFMNVVRGTRLYDAIHQAFDKGATISGTSAGAAVMSEIMITGEEKDKKGNDNFKVIKKDNVITSRGMGFITKAVIDQHFIMRSRYNRLLSVLADHPDKMVIGIDESTAIIVKGTRVEVAGESQVLVVSRPKKPKVSGKDKVAFKNAKLSLFTAGDTFELK